MAHTVDELVALAKDTKAFSPEQIRRLGVAAQEMTEAQGDALHQKLVAIRDTRVAQLKNKISAYKDLAAAHKEWQSDQSRNERQAAEATAEAHDDAAADALIQGM